jgi:PAS domain S-box-containing protein
MVNSYLKAILDNSPDCIVLIGRNHEVLAFNRTIKEVLKQYFGREIKVNDLYYPDFVIDPSKELYLDTFNKAIQGETLTVQHLTKNENVSIWFEYRMTPVYDETGCLFAVSLSARDITNEKSAELKIVELSEKLKAILDNTDESITLLDLDYRILAINSVSKQAIKSNTNIDASIGNDFRDFIPDKANFFYEYYPKALKGQSSAAEISYKDFNGNLLWYQTRFNPVFGDNGEQIGVSIFAKDITEYKNAEIKIRERESLLTALFNNIEGSLSLYDVNKKLVLFNNHFAANYKLLTNRDPKVGDRVHDFLSEEQKKEPVELMNSALKGNKEVFEKDYLSNGKFASFRTSFNPVINDGRVTGITSYSLDLTKSKETEKRITESEEKFRLSFMTSQDAFYIGTLEDGRIIDVNNSFYELFGYSREECLGRTSTELRLYIYPKERAAMVASLKTNGSLKDLEMTCRKKNGQLMLVSITVNLWQMNNEQVIMAVIRDITERKRIDTELIESKEQMALFVEYSPASLAMFDNEMRYIATSRRWMNDYNLGDQNIIGKTHYEVFPEIGQEWKDIHQRCLKGTIEGKEEDSFIRQDGTTDWMKWEIRPWHKGTGEIGGIIMFTEVITEKKETELKFKNLVERSLVGVYIAQKGKLIYVNPKFAQDLGYTQEEMLNIEDFRQVVDEQYKPDELIQWREKVDAGIIDDIHIELKYKKKDGTIIWAEVYCGETLYKGAKAILGTFQDITERKNVEVAIKEQAGTFSAIIENANESIWLLSPNLTVLQFNKTAKERLQLNGGKEIFPGANFQDFLYLGSDNVFMPMFNEAASGKYVERESCQADIHGNMFWLRTKMYPIYDTQKGLIGVTVLAENITDRKKVEKELEQREEMNRALIENISDTIILLNEQLKVTYQSPSYVRTTGFSIEDLKEKTVLDILHPDEMAYCLAIVEQSKASPGVAIPLQLRTLHKKGHYIWIEGTATNLLQNDSIKAFVLNYRDVTERKKSEEQLALSASIVNSSDDAIISKTIEGIITSWNRGAEKVLGYSAEEMIGQSISRLVPPHLEGEEKKMLAEIAKGNSIDHYETQRLKKNGELIYVSLTVSPIHDTLGKVIGASKIMRDVTELKEEQFNREKMTTDLTHRYNELMQFNYIVSHNLRAPLANILGLTNLFAIETDKKEKENTVAFIRSSAMQMDEVIRDLTNILALKSPLNEKKELINLKNIIYSIDQMLSTQINEAEATVTLSISPEANSFMSIKSYMESVLYNLINNAVKYRSPKRQLVITIEAIKKEKEIIIKVADNGIGINLELHKEKVFGLYTRFNIEKEGKGLGLFMTKLQVESIGGRIELSSAPDEGSVFTITLKTN